MLRRFSFFSPARRRECRIAFTAPTIFKVRPTGSAGASGSVGAFPAGVSEVPLSESMGTEPRGFFVASQSEAKARILCLGDSITEGNETMVVYKGPLYDKLTTAGYRFEYVGSRSSTYTSPTYGSLTLEHEGSSSKNYTEIAGFFATNSPLYPADIVIIHSAHNLNVAGAVLDAAAEAAIVTTVENATRAMIQTARNTNPAAKILLAKVITSGKLPKYSYIPAVDVSWGKSLRNSIQTRRASR